MVNLLSSSTRKVAAVATKREKKKKVEEVGAADLRAAGVEKGKFKGPIEDVKGCRKFFNWPGVLEELGTIAWNRCHDADVAEAVVNDCYKAFIKELARGNPIENPYGFAKQVLRCAVANHYQRTPSFSCVDSAILDPMIVDPQPDPATAMERAEQARAAESLIHQMPEPDRSIVQMRIFGGEPLAAIAVRLGLKSSLVANRFHSAMVKLARGIGVVHQRKRQRQPRRPRPDQGGGDPCL